MAKRLPLHAGEDRLGMRSGRGRVDVPFLMLVLLLLAVGLAMLYSASLAQSMYDSGYRTSFLYFRKQAVCALIGLGAMFMMSKLPVKLWHDSAWLLYGQALSCCCWCWLPVHR